MALDDNVICQKYTSCRRLQLFVNVLVPQPQFLLQVCSRAPVRCQTYVHRAETALRASSP
jgi:hypothetical protein